MKITCAVVAARDATATTSLLASVAPCPLLAEIVVFSSQEPAPEWPGVKCIAVPAGSSEAIDRLLTLSAGDYIWWIDARQTASVPPEAAPRCLEVAEATGGNTLIYGDYSEYSVNDYEEGGIRDTFDFGPFLFLSRRHVVKARSEEKMPALRFGGLYDLRLKLSVMGDIVHLREPLGTRQSREQEGWEMFDYVDPVNREYQEEMEKVATAHLKRLGAYLPPIFSPISPDNGTYPVEVSIVIPVRNRAQTIGTAIDSALGQVTGFPFNVIVVDNHSTDGTSELLDDRSSQEDRLVVLRPERRDLHIGGCWNLALDYPLCGRFAVQLDSDDVYARLDAVKLLIDVMKSEDYGMVIGAYTLVDGEGKAIHPGLIDHREWTDDNGRNNALRVNGLGAPRAFRTHLMRKLRFPNVSYGEDYAVALRLSREYRIGRIYDNLYLCRRWAGNTDAALPPEVTLKNDAFKDRIRSLEITARKRLNRIGGRQSLAD